MKAIKNIVMCCSVIGTVFGGEERIPLSKDMFRREVVDSTARAVRSTMLRGVPDEVQRSLCERSLEDWRRCLKTAKSNAEGEYLKLYISWCEEFVGVSQLNRGAKVVAIFELSKKHLETQKDFIENNVASPDLRRHMVAMLQVVQRHKELGTRSEEVNATKILARDTSLLAKELSEFLDLDDLSESTRAEIDALKVLSMLRDVDVAKMKAFYLQSSEIGDSANATKRRS